MQYSPLDRAQESITLFQTVAYGLPLVSIAFLMGPVALLQGIYAKYFGVALTTIATVLLIARIFDAITDPLIGYFSDSYYARHGHRKPFMITGALLLIISSWFLFVPFGYDSGQGGKSVSGLYFLVWFSMFYLAYTLFEIPHMAWGSELAKDSQGKSKVFSVRAFLSSLAGLLFFSIPLLPWFESNELTPETLKWSVLVAGALMLPLMYFCLKYVPGRQEVSWDVSDCKHSAQRESWLVVLHSMAINKPLLTLTLAQVCTGFGSGMFSALLFITADTYLGLGQHFALVYVISLSLSLLSLKLWILVAKYGGKQKAWITGMLLNIIGIFGFGVLSPGATDWLGLLFCMTLIFSGLSAFMVMVPSLLSDIIDYSTWKYGRNRAATYFSLFFFINKAVGALGAALALAIVGWAGFDPAVTTHSDEAVASLRLAMIWIPMLFILLSIVFITRIPITSYRHSIVFRRLDCRARREG